MTTPRRLLAPAILFGIALGAPSALRAQSETPENWPAVKCERYTKAWGEALAKFGRKGLGQPFIEAHEAFLSSGCSIKGEVCPRSKEELDLANVMVILGMNQGMASTFMPFSCPKRS